MDRLRVHTGKKNHCNAAPSGSEEDSNAGILVAKRFATFYSYSFILLQAIREPREIVENGLSVFNPLLVGAMSYILIPQIYGTFDAFSFLLVFLATIVRYVPAFHVFIEYF